MEEGRESKIVMFLQASHLAYVQLCMCLHSPRDMAVIFLDYGAGSASCFQTRHTATLLVGNNMFYANFLQCGKSLKPAQSTSFFGFIWAFLMVIYESHRKIGNLFNTLLLPNTTSASACYPAKNAGSNFLVSQGSAQLHTCNFIAFIMPFTSCLISMPPGSLDLQKHMRSVQGRWSTSVRMFHTGDTIMFLAWWSCMTMRFELQCSAWLKVTMPCSFIWWSH